MSGKKPGGGSSKMGVTMGVIMIVVGVLWTAAALSMDKSMAVFGVVWTVIAIGHTIYNFKHGSDVSGLSLSDLMGGGNHRSKEGESFGTGSYCPYCGTKAEGDHMFCKQCGKKLS